MYRKSALNIIYFRTKYPGCPRVPIIYDYGSYVAMGQTIRGISRAINTLINTCIILSNLANISGLIISTNEFNLRTIVSAWQRLGIAMELKFIQWCRVNIIVTYTTKVLKSNYLKSNLISK